MENNIELYHSIAPNGVVMIKDYEALVNAIANGLNGINIPIITDDDTNRVIKNTRTDLNKKANAIKRFRIDTKADIIELFETQCNNLENMVKAKIAECDEAIANYKKSKELVSESIKAKDDNVVTYVIKCEYSKELEEQITAMCEHYKAKLTKK